MVVDEAFVNSAAHRRTSTIISGSALQQVGTWHRAKSLHLLKPPVLLLIQVAWA